MKLSLKEKHIDFVVILVQQTVVHARLLGLYVDDYEFVFYKGHVINVIRERDSQLQWAQVRRRQTDTALLFARARQTPLCETTLHREKRVGSTQPRLPAIQLHTVETSYAPLPT